LDSENTFIWDKMNLKMNGTMIRRSNQRDFDAILSIINEASRAYKGVIPDDCWKEPYMPAEELAREVGDGVEFWLFQEEAAGGGAQSAGERFEVLGVMGIQRVRGEAALVRHAYVRPSKQNQGIGGKLLNHIVGLGTSVPLLVGTWKGAGWAIRFYEKHGFSLVTPSEKKDELLKKYWSIPRRQVEESVVLADRRYFLTDREK
jgi:GNAT superfamily N-acetyltransferase